jgi:hypothetical protein
MLFGFLAYLYLYMRRDFRVHERSYSNKLSLLDPRPGFFPFNDTSFDTTDAFIFEFLEDSGVKPFLDTRFPILRPIKNINNYGNVNSFNTALAKDPHFLSKLLYYYTDIYIYNSIHNFWLAVSKIDPGTVHKDVFKNSESYAGHANMRFYPTGHFGLSDTLKRFSPTAPYIRSQTFVFNTIRHVYGNTAACAFSDSLYLRYLGDPFFRIGVAVSDNRTCFPYYKTDSLHFYEFRSFLEDFLLSPSRLEFLLYSLREDFQSNSKELLRSSVSNFNLKVKNSVFSLFPKFYYFRWLSYFLSFFLTENSLNLRFKNILIPEHWYNLMSMYRYKRKPNRSRAGLHFSRLGTGQMRYNTDYTYKRGILEFVFNSSLYPVNGRFKNYYYLNGFTRFNILESFDPVGLIVTPFFMRPLKFYVNRIRAHMKDSQKLDFREPLKIFEIRRLIRKSGDGMEPFLSVDHFMHTTNVNFVNDLGSETFDDNFSQSVAYDLYTESLPIFLGLANASSMTALSNFDFQSNRSVNMALSMDNNWSILKDMVASNPSFRVYLQNLAYNKYSSEFYGWFKDKHGTKPLFQFYETSLGLFLKSPIFIKFLGNSANLPAVGLGRNGLSVFDSYKNLTSKVSLQFLLNGRAGSSMRLFKKCPEPLIFKLNKVKRSALKRVSLASSVYKKVRFSFKHMPRLSLNRLSPYTALKFTNYELLDKRFERARLRVLLRDPFLLFSKSRKFGRNKLFRRFLWSNIFLKPALAASLNTPASSSDNFSETLSNFLVKELTPWLCDKYNLSTVYINYIFSDLTIFYRYTLFSYKERGCLDNYELPHQELVTNRLWNDLSKDQFNVSLWRLYLSKLFSNNYFYSYTISSERPLKSTLLGLTLDNKRSLDFLLEIKNNYILQFPTKYLNFIAVHSSEGSMSFRRGTWALLVSTLNALVYLLLKSILSGNGLSCGKTYDNFFILLEQLKRDSEAYNHVAKHLFLTLDPLYDFKHMPGIIPDDYASLLGAMGRTRSIDWWEGIPDSTGLKAIRRVLQVDSYRNTAIDDRQLGSFMVGFWDDFGKHKFITSLKNLSSAELPVKLILKIFNKGVTRASLISAMPSSYLSKRLVDLVCLIFLNDFRASYIHGSVFSQRYNNSIWKLDSFYGVKCLSNFFFNSKVEGSSYVESYLQDSRFFYTKDLQSSLAIHRTPIGLRSRVGALRVSHLFSLNSLNNTLRSDWYYSLFLQKPSFHHERLSLNILNDSGYIFLNRPVVNVRFYKSPFFYFLAYWLVKQFSLFFSVTLKYSIKRYHYSYVYDPLNS